MQQVTGVALNANAARRREPKAAGELISRELFNLRAADLQSLQF
jgi:hypothetical protein